MTTLINASPTNGLVQTPDGSGVLKVQSNGVTTNALAWVNFNGTGTVAIRSSYNVSSITDNGTGDYTVNFATALSDANYAAFSTGSVPTGGGGTNGLTTTEYLSAGPVLARTTSSYRFLTMNVTWTSTDSYSTSVAIFGN